MKDRMRSLAFGDATGRMEFEGAGGAPDEPRSAVSGRASFVLSWLVRLLTVLAGIGLTMIGALRGNPLTVEAGMMVIALAIGASLVIERLVGRA